MSEKRIEVCRMRAGDIKTEFGNPRKISKKNMERLVHSMERYGDFGIYLIDEQDNIIGGNQRLKVVLEKFGPDKVLDCKRLIGYTDAELRAINVKDNSHAGEWDLDLLTDWTIDLKDDEDLAEVFKKDADALERSIDEMELVHYEKYDYVMIVCRDELSYNNLVRALGIEDKKTLIGPKKRKIKARAIWYDDMKAELVPKKYDEQTSVPVYGEEGEAGGGEE